MKKKRLEKIKKFTPKYIREQIESRPELSFISYTEDDKIIIAENVARKKPRRMLRLPRVAQMPESSKNSTPPQF